jgi:hypothetical protein
MPGADQLFYCKNYLRRKYGGAPNTDPPGAPDLASLRTLADTCFNSATQDVVITSTNVAGEQVTGQAKFDKTILGLAIEELLLELGGYAGPCVPPEDSGVALQFFR